MKVALAFIAGSAQAGDHIRQVKTARFNAVNQSIEVDVSYSGGGEEPVCKIQVGICFESMPPHCSAKGLDLSPTPDFGLAFIHQTISFRLADYGLTDDSSDGASIQIGGDGQGAFRFACSVSNLSAPKGMLRSADSRDFFAVN